MNKNKSFLNELEKRIDDFLLYDNYYECNSINNTKVFYDELKILRKIKHNNYYAFEFGKDENNIKKRYYNNEEDFKIDFENLNKIKEELMLNG